MPIEFSRSFKPRTIRHVLMDWDGTTSLGRAGWGQLMTGVYLENLPPTEGEDDMQRRSFAWSELMRLNGQPSIHQMAHLADLVLLRGGTPADPADYQAEFQRRLGDMVQTRFASVRTGRQAPDALLVHGVRTLFDALTDRGIRLTLASGTPLPQLREEAELLRVAHYFEDRIHGPADTHDQSFSKRATIEALVRHDALEGSALLAFGDGPVEITETKAVGGLAIGVASDEEEHGSGRVDDWKRSTLFSSGADAVVADFRDCDALLDALLP